MGGGLKSPGVGVPRGRGPRPWEEGLPRATTRRSTSCTPPSCEQRLFTPRAVNRRSTSCTPPSSSRTAGGDVGETWGDTGRYRGDVGSGECCAAHAPLRGVLALDRWLMPHSRWRLHTSLRGLASGDALAETHAVASARGPRSGTPPRISPSLGPKKRNTALMSPSQPALERTGTPLYSAVFSCVHRISLISHAVL